MKVAGASRRSNFATSPRRDVPTSRRPHVVTSQRRDVGSTNTTVNKQYVVTSQRLDVSTSRRGNVATSARDLPSIIKSSKGSEFEGDWEAYERGHRIPEQQRHRLRRSTRDLYCFQFLLDTRMMFLKLNIYIFLFSMF